MSAAACLELPDGIEIPVVAVVFDLDGVLVDSRDAWQHAERVAIESMGLTWDDAAADPMIGTDPRSANERLAVRYGLSDRVDDVTSAVESAALTVFPRLVRPIAGAADAVRRIASSVPVAVATNSPAAVARVSIAAGGVEALFETVVTADDVVRGKPDPAVYLHAVGQLGIVSGSVAAFEDSTVGIASAQAAGLSVIAFGDALPRDLPGVSGFVTHWEQVRVRRDRD